MGKTHSRIKMIMQFYQDTIQFQPDNDSLPQVLLTFTTQRFWRKNEKDITHVEPAIFYYRGL